MKDTLQQVKDTIQTATQSGMTELTPKETDSISWWMILALFELLVILVLLIRLKKIHKETLSSNDGFDELRKAKSQDIDMANLMNSINSSRELYMELSRECHPDRFQDETIKTKAENLFKEISENKRNYAKLSELKELAIIDLNIKF